jgi:hypothetical protein
MFATPIRRLPVSVQPLRAASRAVPALLAALFLLAGCGAAKEQAQQLLADVDATVTAAGAEAQQQVPEQVAEVNARLAALKSSFDQGDYAAVMKEAPALLAEAKRLAAAAGEKKAALIESMKGQWTALSAGVPGVLAAVEAKLAAVKQAARLPAGMNAAAVQAADATVTAAKATWAEAATAFTSGDVQGAVAKAQGVKTELVALAARLGVTLPADASAEAPASPSATPASPAATAP